ncbi:MAG: homoserine dehydrogenase [Lachnospiraceae bacterium]|jgi:predicted homoserine dehydrogenase-like protein|nr:homoserine dehydrogenase [Lachnospiraceae bacterium]
MDYSFLIKNSSNKKSRVGIVGATSGYGYTLLAQISQVSLIKLRMICALDAKDCQRVLLELGYDKERIVICENIHQLQAAPDQAILVLTDYRLVPNTDITALVECTGNTVVGSELSEAALKKGIHVYMVSKETDSVCGSALNQIAKENRSIYTLVNGDQPRNLLDLISWGRVLGLDIVCAGKSSEYDFVWNPDTSEFTYLNDTDQPHEPMPGMKALWKYQGTETLKKREYLLEKYRAVIAADLCEMNLVSNATGMAPACQSMHYPIAKINELADIFIPKEDGGILEKTGVVDVFCNLRRPDEASFAGGVFIIIRCKNQKVWKILAGKGHVVSQNRKYACVYLPYHYMGLESPISILLGDLMGIGANESCRQTAVMAAVAQEDIAKGTLLKVHGHHHSIDHIVPELWEKRDAMNIAPFYLLNNMTLLNDIKKGDPITLSDVNLKGQRLYELYQLGMALE